MNLKYMNMKKIIDFCLGVLKKINLIYASQAVLIGLLLYAGIWCMKKYQAWNIIPSHQKLRRGLKK